jgi:hypothetical protein
MKPLSIIAFLVVFFTTISSAQQAAVDVLYLKNGSIIRGQLIELSVGNVKIKTADGSIFVYSMADVEKMVKDTEPVPVPAAAPVAPPSRKPASIKLFQ